MTSSIALMDRARRTIAALRDMWGDGVPPGPDPLHTLMTDVVAFDDADGRARGLVVQGDGLPLATLRCLVLATGSIADRLALLPEPLRVLAATPVLPVAAPS